MSQPIHEARWMIDSQGLGAALIAAEKREVEARNPVVSRDEWAHAYATYAYIQGRVDGKIMESDRLLNEKGK